MTTSSVPAETTSAEYYQRAEDEIEALASSGGSPAIVSILSLILKGVNARSPSLVSPITP